MKRMLALVLALMLLLALCAGCGKKTAEDDTAPVNASDAETPDAQPSEPTGADAEALYAPLIERYREAFLNFSHDSYDLEINYLIVDTYSGSSQVGYAFYDIDGDGTPELLIGARDEQNPEQMPLEGLAGIYTLKAGTPKWLIGSDYEFAGVKVLKEGKIIETRMYWGTQIKEGFVSIVYEIKAGELSAEKTYFGVNEFDEAEGVYKVTQTYSVDGALPVDGDDEVLLDQMQPIDPEEYQAAMAAFNGEVMTIPITLFSAQDTNAPAS
ncbi:MAG: hypothetical protein IJL52_01275 [Clostridia bacterium]|nr:hypothetical protein [Clostridia bacterium]